MCKIPIKSYQNIKIAFTKHLAALAKPHGFVLYCCQKKIILRFVISLDSKADNTL